METLLVSWSSYLVASLPTWLKSPTHDSDRPSPIYFSHLPIPLPSRLPEIQAWPEKVVGACSMKQSQTTRGRLCDFTVTTVFLFLTGEPSFHLFCFSKIDFCLIWWLSNLIIDTNNVHPGIICNLFGIFSHFWGGSSPSQGADANGWKCSGRLPRCLRESETSLWGNISVAGCTSNYQKMFLWLSTCFLCSCFLFSNIFLQTWNLVQNSDGSIVWYSTVRLHGKHLGNVWDVTILKIQVETPDLIFKAWLGFHLKNQVAEHFQANVKYYKITSEFLTQPDTGHKESTRWYLMQHDNGTSCSTSYVANLGYGTVFVVLADGTLKYQSWFEYRCLQHLFKRNIYVPNRFQNFFFQSLNILIRFLDVSVFLKILMTFGIFGRFFRVFILFGGPIPTKNPRTGPPFGRVE